MCEYLTRIRNAYNNGLLGWVNSEHEDSLHCEIGKKLEANKEFTPKNGTHKRKVNQNREKIGKEFGVYLRPEVDIDEEKPYYVDLAGVHWEEGKKSNEPKSIEFLCEIKIINPKQKKIKGRWYPYFYPKFSRLRPDYADFLQTVNNSKFFTDADEGQIFYDLMKMVACRNKYSKWYVAKIYQILAIKKEDNILNFEDCKYQIINLLKYWVRHIQNTLPKVTIYDWQCQDEDIKKIALQCNLQSVKGCKIDLLADSDKYIHVLLDWNCTDTDCLDFKFYYIEEEPTS